MKKLYTAVLLAWWVALPGAALAQTSTARPAPDLVWQTRQQWAGSTALEAADVQVTDSYTESNGLTHTYVQQLHAGIPVYRRIVTLTFVGGQLRHHAGAFVPARQFAGLSVVPSIPAAAAIGRAAGPLAASRLGTPTATSARSGAEQRQTWAAPGISRRDLTTSLVWVLDEQQRPRLAWNVNVDLLASANWLNIRVDAATGQVLEQDSWTAHEAPATAAQPAAQPLGPQRRLSPQRTTGGPGATYWVVPFPQENPGLTTLASETDPWNKAGATNNATTYGWQFDGATTHASTRGNNVWAYDDSLRIDQPGRFAPATATAPLVFGYAPDFTKSPTTSRNRLAGTVNLFYWSNLMHDVFYQYGFTETAGNFQYNNLGRGGTALDHVCAEAQDGGGIGNANFTTPPDGVPGRMQMYLWEASKQNLIVSQPATIAGRYLFVEGELSANNKLEKLGAVTGSLAFYNDPGLATHLACGAPPTAGLAGKVALIYRGDCSFASKVLSAQQVGALAVIVVNNVGGGPTIMADNEDAITIPAVMVSQSDGNLLAAQLSSGNDVKLTLSPTQPLLDGAFDNSIVTHEYGHGISTRLTGGPANSSCLSNEEQAGEGWSDYFALLMTTNWAATPLTAGPRARPVGTYASGQGANGLGLRHYPYCTDMSVNPLTYANLKLNPEVHAIGEVWCATLWDLTWALIQVQGRIEPDLYRASSTGGNAVALQLVMQGLKLQPCQPGFLDSRDAILAADSLLYGGRYHCLIWSTFARRGMGYSARQGSSRSATDQVPAFDVPGVTLRKNVGPLVGDNFTLNLTATCECTPATPYTLTDQLPDGLAYVSSTGGTLTGNKVVFANQNFTQGQTRTFQVQLRAAPGRGCSTSTPLNDNRDAHTAGGLTPATLRGSNTWGPSSGRAYSGTSAWFAPEPTSMSDVTLTSAAFVPGSAAVLSFYHFYDTERSFDGGLVAISANNGATWVDAAPYFLDNGYNAVFNAGTASAGQPCFSGLSSGRPGAAAFGRSLLDLSAFTGQAIQVRFQFQTDGSTAGSGWYLDDVQVMSGCGGTQQIQLLASDNTVVGSYGLPTFLTPSPLPVELANFTATPLGAAVRLGWTTASELNSAYFDVERSSDGLQFNKIGQAAASGSSTAAHTYQWLDAALPPGAATLYYRLREVDQDGTATYSPVRSVALSGAAAGLTLFPNPTHTAATLAGAAPAQPVLVLDALGRTILRTTTDASGAAQLLLPAGLPAGVYVVRAGSQALRLAVE